MEVDYNIVLFAQPWIMISFPWSGASSISLDSICFFFFPFPFPSPFLLRAEFWRLKADCWNILECSNHITDSVQSVQSLLIVQK